MKKIIIVAALVIAAVASAKAEIVSRDTIAYSGTYRLEKVEKTNKYGEISVRYVAYLNDITNSKGEPRKVSITKAVYNSGKITHIVYNTNDSGSRKIGKAINIESK